MPLPYVPLDRAKVDLGDGVSVEVRGLSREETLALGQMGDDPDDADVFILTKGTDTAEDETRLWRAAVPNDAADRIVDAVMRLTKLGQGAQKSDGTGSDAR